MLTQAIGGAGYLLLGVRLITRPGIRRFVVIPMLVNILVFLGAIWLSVRQFERLMALIEARIPGWLGWLDWLLWPIFIILMLVVVFYSFSLVANLLAAPFNGLLAEQIEAHLNATPPQQDDSWQSALRELPATLYDELRKVGYAIGWALPFLLLLFVPVIGPPLWFLYTAWMLALEYSDYPMGNHGLKFRQMRACLKANRPLALGFGAATAGLALVPVLNFVVMPAAVAGATAMWVRELGGARSQGGYRPGGAHQSRMTTRRVTLLVNHLSGRISGWINAGEHSGAQLERLTTQELFDLLEDYYRTDPESAEALEVYLEHQRGERQHSRHDGPPPGARTTGADINRAVLDANQARAILGVEERATAEDIRAAHRRLMMRLHPDRGGTDYLAARINEAKDLLTR